MNQNKINKYFCPTPFASVVINPDNTVRPCCFFRQSETPDDFTINYKNLFYDHPFMNKIREDMRQGKPLAGCTECYETENLVGRSMRTDRLEVRNKSLKENGREDLVNTIPENPTLTFVDLSFSNACNNRCRMCNPRASSNWYADAKALGMPIPKGLNQSDYDYDGIDFSKLTFLKVIGGEPLMEQEKFISVLKKCDLSKLTVQTITNLTLRPNEELLDLLAQCKSVKWRTSVDAYGSLNEFIRKGSVWEETKENLDWYVKTFPGEVRISSVVNIYNANVFYKLSEYVQEKYPGLDEGWVMPDGANWLSPENLSDNAKNFIADKLSKINHYFVPMILDFMKKPGDINAFVSHDKKLNKIRNETWFEHNPELYELLKEYYE